MELKACPFCGEHLIKKTEELLRGHKPITFYEHPVNGCILAVNTDEFPYIVTEGTVCEWNKRAGQEAVQ